MSKATASVGRRADIPASEVSFWVNAGYFEVAGAVPHALQERIAVSSTTTGENKIALPSDFGEPISFSLVWSNSTQSSALSSRVTLHRISVSEAEKDGHLPVGEPKNFVLYNDWIELFPSPNSAYSLYARYRSMVTDMVETSHVPSVSTPWRHAILLKTQEHLHNYLGNMGGAAQARNAYLDYVLRLDSDEAKRQKGEWPHHVSAPLYKRKRYR